MAQTRELRRRIRSVENTRQITRTMEMVATSKLKRATDRVAAARPYARALTQVLADLYDPELAERFPLLRRSRVQHEKVALVGLTSSKGLCGGFNANLIKRVRSRLDELGKAGHEAELHVIGRKGVGYFRYIGQPMASHVEAFSDRPTMDDAVRAIEPLVDRFAAGTLDAVEIVFAKFISPLSTPPTTLRILPVDLTSGGHAGGDAMPARPANYILAPSASEIVGAILPLYVRNQMYRALVETVAAEQGARRTAMKSATDNAGEMLDGLRRTYNRARQGLITQELAEIVGGAEAL